MIAEETMTTQQYWDSVALKCYNGEKPMETGLLTVNFPKVRYIVRQLLKYDMVHKKILEIGIGTGLVMAALRLMHMEQLTIKATDVSPLFAEGSKGMFGIDTFVAQAMDLPFKDNEFDSIMMLDVLEHIHPDEKDRSYEEINRVFNNGFIFINNPSDEYVSGHDANFDHGFKPRDLIELCEATNTKVYEFSQWAIAGKRKYEWIVLEGK